jgi:hypothetical protein
VADDPVSSVNHLKTVSKGRRFFYMHYTCAYKWGGV